MRGKAADISGQRFGRLLVLGRAPDGRHPSSGARLLLWLLQCDCGQTRTADAGSLRNGNVTSCGCRQRETQYKVRHQDRRPLVGAAARQPKGAGPLSPVCQRTHGMSGTPEYRSWKAMRERCGNPNASNWAKYGGRGITVCERWRLFANFLADMGPRPSLGHSLDRFPNNDGHYEPGNVRWATTREQALNKRRPAKGLKRKRRSQQQHA